MKNEDLGLCTNNYCVKTCQYVRSLFFKNKINADTFSMNSSKLHVAEI